MQENKYIGDEKMAKMLEHYNCPTPLEVVKMRFAGAICSPNLELRPTDVISSFWPQGQAPRLQTKDEADLFFKFFMGLWDEIFNQVQSNKIKLDKISAKDIAYYCERRYAEIELGYVEGFWGGKQDIKIPGFLAELIDNISELATVYNTLSKKFANGAGIDEIMQAIQSCDKTVEKSISFIIENSVLPRIESLKRIVN
ncbi:MAG: hypothetical protein IJW72_04925 [Alphaproteobacteria bacterium]|nr:hypothetical protein [Alphaproteobacteria bacterium]